MWQVDLCVRYMCMQEGREEGEGDGGGVGEEKVEVGAC